MNLRSCFVAGAAAVALATLAAVSNPAADAAAIPHTLRFTTAEDIATLNPDINTQIVVMYLSQMTAAYAFRLDHENRLVPEIATVIPTLANGGISRDGKTITLHLRRGVKWSDGAPFDSSDVAFTIAAINSPANVLPSRQGFDQITRTDTPDKYTVIIRLRAPFGAIVPTLFSSSNAYAILPKHLLGSLRDMNHAAFNGLPIGIGPFRYVAWKRGDEIVLDRNPYYWRGTPALERVVLKLIPDRNTALTQLQTGELDMWYPLGGSFLSRVAALPTMRIIRQPGYAINQILLNLSHAPLADPGVREALRDAVDRRLIRDKVGHGVGVLQNVIVPTIDPSAPKNIAFTPFNIGKANGILDRDGWTRGADGVRVKRGQRLAIDFASTVGTPDADTMIELIRSTWSAIGVELHVHRYESSVLFGPYESGGILDTGKFDAVLYGRYLSPPFDLNLNFGCKQFPPIGQNESRYCNPRLDAITTRYDRAYDEALRTALLSRALHIINDDTVVIVTTGREDIFAVDRAVTHFRPNAATPFDDMMSVDVSDRP